MSKELYSDIVYPPDSPEALMGGGGIQNDPHSPMRDRRRIIKFLEEKGWTTEEELSMLVDIARDDSNTVSMKMRAAGFIRNIVNEAYDEANKFRSISVYDDQDSISFQDTPADGSLKFLEIAKEDANEEIPREKGCNSTENTSSHIESLNSNEGIKAREIKFSPFRGTGTTKQDDLSQIGCLHIPPSEGNAVPGILSTTKGQ